MINNIKKFIKKNLTLQTPETLFSKEEGGYINLNKTKILNCGELNKDKVFYVIKRTPGTGLFSNVVFVLNHLKIAKKNNFIPIVDMSSFKTIYNEKKKLFKTFNSWNYYFENVSKYSLNEVYKSNKVIIVCDKFFHHFIYNMDHKDFNKTISEKIKINKKFIKLCKKFETKNFGKKTLGVHFRGTSYKQSPGHPMPATVNQMISLVKYVIQKDKIEKIFIATEEKNYLKKFKKEFPNNLVYIENAYRSDKNDAFKVYPRLNHRYKLGREALIETILLSKCDSFIFLNSNISSASMAFNLNPNQKKYKIDNGFNSKNIFISMFYWYLKKILPNYLGGFKNTLNFKNF